MLHNNAFNVNKKRLEIISGLARRTIELTVSTIDDGILSEIKDTASSKEFSNNVREVIKNKLRKKFNV